MSNGDRDRRTSQSMFASKLFARAAAVFGPRSAPPIEYPRAVAAPDHVPPSWLWELDEYEGGEEFLLALHAELGDLLEARSAGVNAPGGRSAKAPRDPATSERAARLCNSRRRSGPASRQAVNDHRGRRGECPKTRP